MFLSLSRQLEFSKNLKALKKDRTPCADDTGALKCQRSGMCCNARPGALDNKDIVNIARYLKIEESELCEKYLCVDRIEDVIILPIRKGQEDLAGKAVPEERTFDSGACIFLTEFVNGLKLIETKCDIHDVKPKGCRELIICSSEPVNVGWTEDKVNERFINVNWYDLED